MIICFNWSIKSNNIATNRNLSRNKFNKRHNLNTWIKPNSQRFTTIGPVYSTYRLTFLQTKIEQTCVSPRARGRVLHDEVGRWILVRELLRKEPIALLFKGVSEVDGLTEFGIEQWVRAETRLEDKQPRGSLMVTSEDEDAETIIIFVSRRLSLLPATAGGAGEGGSKEREGRRLMDRVWKHGRGWRWN